MKYGKRDIKFRKKLAIILLAIFMIPITYQTVYIAFNHYHDYICTAKNENHFHIKHKSNSKYLLTFFSSFVSIEAVKLQPIDVFMTLINNYQIKYNNSLISSISSRAPPIS